MKNPRLYGLCVVKDEDDIIAQTLTYATRCCDKIFVLDNGSSDETWQIVQSLGKQNPEIVPFGRTPEPWRDGLRSIVYNEVHRKISNEDWWLILDSDEFLAEDPRPVIQRAMLESMDIIAAWQIQFYYTEVDYQAHLEGRDSRNLPIFERRRYYLINWQEPRLFRNQTDQAWDETISNKVPNGLQGVCRQRVLNRHYQFRDPEQIQKRLNLRFGDPHFRYHVKSNNWRDVIRPSRRLIYHKDGDPWRFTPSGLIFYYRWRLLLEARGNAAAAVRKLHRVISW